MSKREQISAPPLSNGGANRQIVSNQAQNAPIVEKPSTIETQNQQNIEPPYYKEIRTDESVYSLDNLRLSLNVPANQWDYLLMKMDIATGRISDYYSSNKIGAYRCLWVVNIDEDVSFSIGLGLNKPSGKVDKTSGFLDFNPNKIGEDERLQHVFNRLYGAGVTGTVKRLDLAIDYYVPRNTLTLLKDRRSYEFYSDKARTEYLGKKNKPGRVKLYDKGAEMGFDNVDITRLEITDSLDLFHFVMKWPKVLDSKAVTDLKGKDLAFLVALLDLVELGQPVEKYLEICKPWTAKRYRNLLEPSCIKLDTDATAHILRQADEWAKYGKLISY